MESGFELAGRRYSAKPLRDQRARGLLGLSTDIASDPFARALTELSTEDEELGGSGGQGPIVFRDGVFQIDYAGGSEDLALDPALKGLIDSILEPKAPAGGERGEG